MDSKAVVLVHGWKSHSGIWNRLIEKLSIPSNLIWNFQYSHLYEDSVVEIARELGRFISKKREQEEYYERIDIVCHSMGGYVTRYYIEVLDGREKKEKVRQLILIGVPNRGSSMAEIFNDPVYGPDVIKDLSGEFVPRQYVPSSDTNVQGLRIRSRETGNLCRAGLRSDIRYRNIMAANRTKDPEFFPRLKGKTWVLCPDDTWQKTWLGDGVIPHADSFLPGTGFDIVPRDHSSFETPPYRYCHIHLPRNPEVIRMVIRYLNHPDAQSSMKWSDEQ